MKNIINKISEIYSKSYPLYSKQKFSTFTTDNYTINTIYADDTLNIELKDIAAELVIEIDYYNYLRIQYQYNLSDYKMHWLYYNRNKYSEFEMIDKNRKLDLSELYPNELQKELKLNDEKLIQMYDFNNLCNTDAVLSKLFGIYVYFPSDHKENDTFENGVDLLYNAVIRNIDSYMIQSKQ